MNQSLPRLLPLILALGAVSGCNSAQGARVAPEHRTPEQGAGTLASGADVSDVIEKVLPSIVSVQSTRTARMENPMGFFFGAPPTERKQEGLGSGVVISSDGLIITNNHVVDGADALIVKTNDDREYEARLLGADAKSDLALLKVQGEGIRLVPAQFGDSSKLRLGETVLAVGNPFGVGQTVTMGIVSAKGRADMGIVDYEDFIQTDAAINPGNSGGALINARGELVGINTAILSRTGGYMGIGFAIPTNMAVPIVDALKENGRVTRGYLGASLQDLNRDLRDALGLKDGGGVLIADVVAGGPGSKAGLRSGDIVTHVAGRPVDSVGRLRNAVASAGAGKSVELSVLREQKKVRLSAVLGALPTDEARMPEPKGHDKEPAGDVDGVVLGELTPEVRAQLGVTKDTQGAVVVRVLPGSKIAQAQVRRGDILLEVNRKVVTSAEAAAAAYKATPGSKLLLVMRGGQKRYVVVK